jgi:glycerophosphoryl diester phosphodiesterase
MVNKIFYITFLFVSLFFISCTAQENLNNPTTAKSTIVAHRGAWKKKNLPQNSIASLKEAIRLNCKGSEFDILLTADDSLVVNHDPNYNNLVIQQSKYSQLVTLKLPNGETLPTLREYILAGKQNNTTVQLFCELKNYNLSTERKKVYVAKTLQLVHELKAEQLVVYSSFDYDILKQIRASNPYADIQYLKGDVSPEQLKLDNISEADYSYDVYYTNLQWIESAKKNNIALSVWTVNDGKNINWFLKNNFDNIITDEPELALSYQAELNVNNFTLSKLDFKVFPNPASNLISIQSISLLTNDFKIEVIDELGKKMTTQTFPQGNSTYNFETESLNNGVYFLKISDENSSKTFKVIIKK